MPSWKQVLDQAKAAGSTHDILRRRFLRQLHNRTGRNVIVYYSGWLQKPEMTRKGVLGFEVNDADKNAFMATIHKMDRSKGLDLILHTPGGEVAATESLVDYLRSMFPHDIRAIIPQIAMSAGTMMALACKAVMMGKHSSLGPIDPQIRGIPAHGIIEEFKQAASDIAASPAMIPVWQPIIAKYHPTLIGECQKAIDWSTKMVRDWLVTGMFKGESDGPKKADRIIKELGDHALTKSHSRHISCATARSLGIKVEDMEMDQKIQDAILSVHHASIQSLGATSAIKLIENQLGVAYVQHVKMDE